MGVWIEFFQILNPLVPILIHFFKLKNLWALLKNWVWFHVGTYTFPTTKDCMGTKFYKKLKHGY